MAIKVKQPKTQTTGVEVMIEPFRLTVKKVPGGFTAQFDGVKDGKLVPVQIVLKFPKWWAEQIIRQMAKVR